MTTITSTYVPRPHFQSFHQRNERFAILVMHRRAGKTVAVVNDLLERCAYNTRPHPRYAYIAPLYRQAKEIAWTYAKDYAAPYSPKISESSLYIELPHNQGRLTLYGADNPDSFRGLYLDGAALDEFGGMKPSIWKEVLLPALLDRRGWAVFMGTPNGPNHFRDMWYGRQDDPAWYTERLTAYDTEVISEEDLDELRRMMDEEEFAQEMLCSFEASTRGAYYARQMERAETQGRVLALTPDSTPLHFAFDLGWRDSTAAWVWQRAPDGLRILRTFSANTRPVSYYIEWIAATVSELRAPQGKVWLPQDARAKSLQTGLSTVEQFLAKGIHPRIVPNLDLLDGIQAARERFPLLFFDKAGTSEGRMALKTYHKEWDEDRKVFKDTPVHDWSSNYADGFRYMILADAADNPVLSGPDGAERTVADPRAHGASYAFTLEDLYGTRSSFRRI